LLVGFSVMLTVASSASCCLHLSGDLATAIAGPNRVPPMSRRCACSTGWTADGDAVRRLAGRGGAARFRRSFYFQNTVMELIGERLPVTLKLGRHCIAAGGHRRDPARRAGRDLPRQLGRSALAAGRGGRQAMPNFWFALSLILVFLGRLKWLPWPATRAGSIFVLPTVRARLLRDAVA